jgi:hypothetical protein
MKFIVYYEINGVQYHKIVKGGRAVESMKKRYSVYEVRRYS